jgi:hypothetical protein
MVLVLALMGGGAAWGCDETVRPPVDAKEIDLGTGGDTDARDSTEIEVEPIPCLTTAPTSCPSPAPSYG